MTDDELLLYYYDELEPAERQAMADALAADPELAERYRQLRSELGRLPDPHVAPPSQAAVERWGAALDRVAGPGPARTPGGSFSWLSFLFGAAVTAALVAGIGIGLYLGTEDLPPADMTAAVHAPAGGGLPPTLVRGVRAHLRDSRDGLLSLRDGEAGRAELISGIVLQNRMYERAAKRQGAGQLARVLRAFDLVLVELASGDLSIEEAEALEAKLLFELEAMLTKLSRPASDRQQRI